MRRNCPALRQRRTAQLSPKIASKVLCATVSKALRLEKHRAQQLVEVLVYRGTSSQEVWTQPLLRCEDDYWLVLPCIHAVHLERIVEGWMRQGGLELERRGPEPERFCRKFYKSLGSWPLLVTSGEAWDTPYISIREHALSTVSAPHACTHPPLPPTIDVLHCAVCCERPVDPHDRGHANRLRLGRAIRRLWLL